MSLYRNIYNGVDLDSIFATRVTAPTSAVGFRNADGQDLSLRYEKANTAPPTSNVGYRGPDGRDLSLWFTTDATGGLSIGVTANNVSYNNGLSNLPAQRTMSAGAIAAATGGTGTYTYTWSIESTSNISSVSLSTTSGNSTTITGTVSINMPGYVTVKCTVSDGVTTKSSTGTSEFNYYNEV